MQNIGAQNYSTYAFGVHYAFKITYYSFQQFFILTYVLFPVQRILP